MTVEMNGDRRFRTAKILVLFLLGFRYNACGDEIIGL